MSLTLEYLQTVVPKSYRKTVSQELVDEINHLSEDPDYGEQFREGILTYSSVLGGKESWSIRQYTDAVKFLGLVTMKVNQTDAYIKVFPERMQSRLNRGETKTEMGGEASRYNASPIINTLRDQARVSFYLRNQDIRQEALDGLMDLGRHARSEVARVTAFSSALKELRPPETHQVEVQVGMNEEAREAQQKQTDKLTEIAINQQKLFKAGIGIEEVQRLHIDKPEAIDVVLDD